MGRLGTGLRWFSHQIRKFGNARFFLIPKGQSIMQTEEHPSGTDTPKHTYLPFPIVDLTERFSMAKCLQCNLSYNPQHDACPYCGSREKGRTATPSEAVQFLDNLLVFKEARTHVQEGTRYFQTGNSLAARAEFRKAIELLPTYAVAHYNLGMVLSQTGYIAEGLHHLQLAVDLDLELRENKDTEDLLARLQQEVLYLAKKPKEEDGH